MKKIFVYILYISLLISVFFVNSFGVFYSYDSGNADSSISTGTLDSEMTIYKARDFNRDGILDTDEYGEEIYDILLNSEVTDFAAEEVFSFKVTVTNLGTIDGKLTVFFYIQEAIAQTLTYIIKVEEPYIEIQMQPGQLNTIVNDMFLAGGQSCNLFFLIKIASIEMYTAYEYSQAKFSLKINASLIQAYGI